MRNMASTKSTIEAIEVEFRALEAQELELFRRKQNLKLKAEAMLPPLKWGDRLDITEGKYAGRQLFVQGTSATWQDYGPEHRFLFRAHGMVCNKDGSLGKGERPREFVAIQPLETQTAAKLAAADALALV